MSFKFLHIAALPLTSHRWLTEGIIEVGSLGEIFGDPEALKTFILRDLLCCIGTGTPFHGRKVVQGPVFLIVGEGMLGIKRRFQAWAIEHGIDLSKYPIFISEGAAALGDEANVREILDGMEETLKPWGGVPVAVGVDTVSRNFGEGNESASADMAAFVRGLDAIRSRFGCAVILVHHPGQADKTRARGALVLRGALDAEYRVSKDASGIVKMECTKMKDAEHPEPMVFRPRIIEIEDDGGQPATSIILDAVDGYEPPAQNAPRGKWQILGLETLEELYQEQAETLGYDPDGAKVPVDDWRSRLMKQGMPRQRWAEVRDTLAGQGLVVVKNGFAFLP